MVETEELNRIKKILQEFATGQLSDANNFDVEHLHLLLGTFPSKELEKELARATREAYFKITDLLERPTQDTTTGTDAEKAAATAHNQDVNDTNTLFFNLLGDDRWDSNSVPSSNALAYGVRNDNDKTLYNVSDVINIMAFGGVAGVNPSTLIGGVNKSSAAEARQTYVDYSTVGNNTDSIGGNIPLNGHELRAVYLHALWAKNGLAVPLFGQGVGKISVVAAAQTIGGAGACAQSYCGTFNTTEDVRTYNIWSNSEAGRNHLVSVLGAMLKHNITDQTGRSTGKVLGGEEAFNVDILNSLVADDGKFTMTQLGHTLQTGAKVSATMTPSELDSAYDLGYDELKHLGVTFNVATDDGLVTKDATGYAGDVIGSRINVNVGTVTTPYLTNILASKYREEFIKSALLQSDKLNTIPNALDTACHIAGFGAENKPLEESFALGQETRTRESQVVNAGFKLVNEARELAGKPAFASLRDLFADHDNDGRAAQLALFNSITTVKTWGTTKVASPTGQQLHTDSDKPENQTIYEEIVAADIDEYTVMEDDEFSKTSADLIANKHFEKNQRLVVQTLVGKVLRANFIANNTQFISHALPNFLAHMKLSASSKSAVTGQLDANIDGAFGTVAGDATTYGRVFSGKSIANLATESAGFNYKTALVYHFMISLLTTDELKAFLRVGDNVDQNAAQLALLLKFTKGKTDTAGTFTPGFFTYRSGAASRGIASTTQGAFMNLSGVLDNQSNGEVFGSDAADTAHKESCKKAIMDAISSQLFSGDAKLLCRLQLTNGLVISAVKVQDIAGEETDLYDFSNTNASILDLDNATGMKVGTDVEGKKFKNKVFPAVALGAIAKASGFYQLRDTSDPPVAEAYDNDDAAAKAIRGARSESLIANIEAALADSTPRQQKEFYLKVVELSKIAEIGGAASDANNYKRLARWIVRQLSLELLDPVGEDHTLEKGWNHTIGDSFTGKDERSILAALIDDVQGVGALTDDAKTNMGGVTDHPNATYGSANNLSYADKQEAIRADKAVLRIAQKAVKSYSDKATALKAFKDETTSSSGKKYQKMIALYMAGFLFEDPKLLHGLYDSDECAAGLGQEAVTSLLKSGAVTSSDLRSEHHIVEIEEEGMSKTNHAVKLESHTFVAIDGGVISVCTGMVDGKPVYEPLDISKRA